MRVLGIVGSLRAASYNGALMHDRNVVVSYNSDSAELARRLNLEAAKAVKYGGVSDEEALKFVTLSPGATGLNHTGSPSESTINGPYCWVPFSDTGPSANQWALPLVDDQGGVDIAYASEDCNTAFDRGLFFKRSTDGGNTFGTTVQIDKLPSLRKSASRPRLPTRNKARAFLKRKGRVGGLLLVLADA